MAKDKSKNLKTCMDCDTATDDYYPSYSKDKNSYDLVRCSQCHEYYIRQSSKRD